MADTVTVSSVSGAAGPPATQTFQVSGETSGAYTGYFMVETQSLQIQYARVPREGYPETHVLDLSSYDVTADVGGTQLNCIITSDYNKSKIYGSYDTCTWNENQTFKIAASEQLHGVSYGAVLANQLGPIGTIFTDTAWYNRRPWNSTIDEATKSSCTGSNVAYMVSATRTWNYDQNTFYTIPENNFKGFHIPYSPLNQWAPFRWSTVAFNPYTIWGHYSTAKEVGMENSIWAFIDDIGRSIKNTRLIKIRPTNSEGFMFLQPGDYVGDANYDISRHKFA